MSGKLQLFYIRAILTHSELRAGGTLDKERSCNYRGLDWDLDRYQDGTNEKKNK